ncbi:YcaO-like family protein [Roseibium sp. MMSF_3544]|uniref:YcaO-like family protein n=1 Tax=unclassified Roseibium TaxID=2629323 RepID=UPI002740165B|nr:YcaO-like family protein [Roseibium sp. MMSF_3544]
MASDSLNFATLSMEGNPSIATDCFAEKRLPKGFLQGTHRTHSPEHLLSALQGDLKQFGITRVSRLTGLDRIGVEVFAAVRPNARGLSVAQGKGCTREAAELSGIMEAIELSHAENPCVPLTFGTRDRTPFALDRAVLDSLLGRPLGDASIFWSTGTNLSSGEPVAVPFDLVHTCFTDDAHVRGVKFPVSTNGLASGASRTEALIHALCEVVERHDTAMLARSFPEERTARILDLESVDDPVAARLLEQFKNADIAVRVWDATGAIGIASCVAAIADLRDAAIPPGFGAGCHASRSVALCRALTEAAQARLTRISGARDDLQVSQFGKAEGIRARWLTEPVEARQRSFAELPDLSTDRLDSDLQMLVTAVDEAGHRPVVGVDLSDDPSFSVVRVIVPGLLGYEVAQ